MKLWSTQIPILPTHSVDELLAVAKAWLLEATNTIWNESEISIPSNKEISTWEKSGQKIVVLKFTAGPEEFAGFRHEWQDPEKFTWTTDICGWRTPSSFLVSVQVSSLADSIGERPRTPKKPKIVKMLLDKLGGDMDGPFSISAEPVVLEEGQLDLAVRILKGETGNFLPVIYVSSTWKNEPALDVRALAGWLSGMAHVVVEPNRRFSFHLAGKVDRINPYAGASAICWPHGSGQLLKFQPSKFTSPHSYSNEICRSLQRALSGRRPNTKCTWDYIRERIFGHKVKALREAGEINLEEYAKAFDAELNATKRQLLVAEQEISTLKRELAQTNETYRQQDEGLLEFGRELDLYPGEHRDVVIWALQIASRNVNSDGRVKEVLDSLMLANQASGTMEKMQQTIKDAVGGCENIGKEQWKALEKAGFSISEDGKHYKLMFRNDERYTFAMAKTGSDHRGMKNWVSDVTKRLFK
jgi:hypothetical protein